MNRVDALALVSELINSENVGRKSIGAEIKRMLDYVTFDDELIEKSLSHAPWCNYNLDCNCKD